MKKFTLPNFVFRGVHLKDLILLQTEMPDRVEGRLVNFRKMAQLSQTLKELTKLQNQDAIPVCVNMDLLNTLRVGYQGYQITKPGRHTLVCQHGPGQYTQGRLPWLPNYRTPYPCVPTWTWSIHSGWCCNCFLFWRIYHCIYRIILLALCIYR